MTLGTIVFVIVAVVVVASIAVATKLASQRGAQSALKPSFKAGPFLTENELEFLTRLEAAVPEFRFHAQVSMGALIRPAKGADGKNINGARNMFSQKIVDFVAQRRTDGAIVAIIELDDRTHDPSKDMKRDGMLTSAGYRTVRWNSRTKPNPVEIRSQLTA